MPIRAKGIIAFNIAFVCSWRVVRLIIPSGKNNRMGIIISTEDLLQTDKEIKMIIAQLIATIFPITPNSKEGALLASFI